ncbi:MAG: transposase [Flavobacteriaceae bacterium]|nr:transposase [Flavobacteriaceae bacterium]
MKKPENNGYVKRTQKDYSLSFKLQLIEEIECGYLTKSQEKAKYGIQGDSTISTWLKKYGKFDWEYREPQEMKKITPEQRIIELEQKVKLLEKQKERAEHLAERADKKVIIFDMLVNMAEKEYDISIRKNYKPELSKTTKKNTKKH